MPKEIKKLQKLAALSAVVLAGCGGSDGSAPATPAPVSVAPTALSCGLPSVSPEGTTVATICPELDKAGQKIYTDPKFVSLVAKINEPEEAKRRFNDFMEIVRIASPSRTEQFRGEEIQRRMVQDYGFSTSQVKTRADGHLPGSDVQLVDGLPVYNACVEIKGSYSSMKDAQSYKGQYPKVLVEGHMDVVFPEKPPTADNRFLPIKLQPYADAVVNTPEKLAALPDQLSFDANGRIIENAQYLKAAQQFETMEAAAQGGGVRIYVPGYVDATPEAIAAMHMARALKDLQIQPVYDMWFCATAGEEGKGNLAGMKQLYGYNQDAGTGTNPLNFVTNFGLDISPWTINFTGSYRFEMKYSVPAGGDAAGRPSALEAAAAAVSHIGQLKTVSDPGQEGGPVTSYTVGTVACEAPQAGSNVVPSCTIQVDMRSTQKESLNAIRAKLEPQFQQGVNDENARYKLAAGDANAVQLELVWFGDRPPHQRTNFSDPAIQSVWKASELSGVAVRTNVQSGTNSLNDNVPAAIGVPSVNMTGTAHAALSGYHTFWEWGTRSTTKAEAGNMERVLLSALIAAGFNATDGTVVAPAAGPIGARTAELK